MLGVNFTPNGFYVASSVFGARCENRFADVNIHTVISKDVGESLAELRFFPGQNSRSGLE
jgi:hypothetical protein